MYCCISGCHNTSKNKSKGVIFYHFPSDNINMPWLRDKRLKWINAVIKQNKWPDNWIPSKSTTICSAHFIGNAKSENYVHPSYLPTSFHGLSSLTSSSSGVERNTSPSVNNNKKPKIHETDEQKSMSCDKQDTRVSRVSENNLSSNVILNSLLKDCFVQINVCNDPLASLESNNKKTISNKHNSTGKRKKQDMVPNSEESLTPDESRGLLNNDRVCSLPKRKPSVSSSTEENFIQIKEAPTFIDAATQKNYDGFSVDKFRDSDESIQFYTGFDNYQEFTYVFDTVYGLKAWHINQKICLPQSILTKKDEFFLTVMKLKQGTPDFVLSQLFNLSVDSVFTIFETWLICMYNNWATQHLPHKNLMDIKMINGVSRMDEVDLKGLNIMNVPEFVKEKKRLQNLSIFRGKGKVNTEETPIQMKGFRILVEPMTSKYLPLWSKIYFACCILSGYKEGRTLKKT